MTEGASSHFPQLALRIGITGARSLDAARIDDLRKKLRDVLGSVKADMRRLAEDKDVRAHYAGVETGEPWLRFVSPLARGADRLAAETALDLGYDLYVPMPFDRAEYEKDFRGAQDPHEPPLSAAEDLAQFTTLLQRAGQSGQAWLTLDGGREEENRAYEAVGRFVVRHSDILIAIWDGKPSNGRGGTAEIVEYALTSGVPVWWIHATEARDPVWLTSQLDLRDPRAPTIEPLAAVRRYIDRQIPPPPPVSREREGLVEAVARFGQRRNVSPLDVYFGEDGKPPAFWASAYSAMMRWAVPPTPPPSSPISSLPIKTHLQHLMYG